MVSANCGRSPVTVTVSLNSTVTSMASPARKTPFAPVAVPAGVTPVTAGPTTSAAPPSTAKSASFAIAWLPKPSAAAFGVAAPSKIVPPFSASASASTEIPSASASPETTV